ncbi:uncharacterized protein MYCFIDRAFT_176623 [Pseudocercospora fijiensis CIRAD86]|uniref:Uncharacterized protein n=1 Tax=Pseudocercospora fijiensis (strain CIRAD86) TaxID=383855 RepID=M3AW41_PSEFD|nr:uncharacterized protein MYCFIDRAFT_176623 [Pseudocercospora fijiensis CIRAD86]EME81338.1 hypothetical protein MYCFIDRAFT_176623 [Pseudocercospora fijiensis CIRAD86]
MGSGRRSSFWRPPPRETQAEKPESTEQSLCEDADEGPELYSNDGTVVQSLSAKSSVRPSNHTSTSPDLERTPDSPEVRSSPEKLRYDFQMYKTQLEDAQDLLWNREEHFDRERQARDERLRAGQKVKTVAEIDIDELQETQRLTRWLIQAEEEYYNAKSALLEAGVQPTGSDVESDFVDDADDSYRRSMEKDFIVTGHC